jgi:hypothetical protein
MKRSSFFEDRKSRWISLNQAILFIRFLEHAELTIFLQSRQSLPRIHHLSYPRILPHVEDYAKHIFGNTINYPNQKK